MIGAVGCVVHMQISIVHTAVVQDKRVLTRLLQAGLYRVSVLVDFVQCVC